MPIPPISTEDAEPEMKQAGQAGDPHELGNDLFIKGQSALRRADYVTAFTFYREAATVFAAAECWRPAADFLLLAAMVADECLPDLAEDAQQAKDAAHCYQQRSADTSADQ
ncbi:MAG: hypothetical protein H0T53_02380 [Herpetosiphonaceae bacterium]|nr:hypothetical protein [Herpetosiphonaceae bacterium]